MGNIETGKDNLTLVVVQGVDQETALNVLVDEEEQFVLRNFPRCRLDCRLQTLSSSRADLSLEFKVKSDSCRVNV